MTSTQVIEGGGGGKRDIATATFYYRALGRRQAGRAVRDVRVGVKEGATA